MNEIEEQKLRAELILCGVEVTEPYKGHILSVEKCEYEYSGKRLTNCIFVSYQVFVQSDTGFDDQDSISRVLLEEINLFLQSLTLMLHHPSQLIHYKTWLNGIEIEPKLPTRDAPLGMYNFVTIWRHRPKNGIRRYSSLVDIDGWPMLEHLITGFRKQPPSIKNDVSLALRWFEKGSNEMESVDRLVAYWIAYNSLYEDPSSNEQEAIKRYIGIHASQQLAKRFIDRYEKMLQHLSSKVIRLGRADQRNISQELADSLRATSRDNILVLKKLALAIYGIRNNLFHGAYDPYSDEVFKLINLAEFLLARLLKELLAKQMIGSLLPSSKFVTQEKIGF